ncbi:unnamed protein product [Calicophoron daubneyi]|uniref:C2H2-type domain-containing protein n=1 Tax=Calicophoron daubneyi TaxID=300641 RepID=A0AAV2TLP6_CALDB
MECDCEDDDKDLTDKDSVQPLQSTKRGPTDEEKKLAKLLIDKVLPPFSKSLALKALVVYRADQEKTKCLLIDQKYEKGLHSQSPLRCDESVNGIDHLSHMSDSGFAETSFSTPISEATSAAITLNGIALDHSESTPFGSRRKRKLCRPCKIPQSTSVSSEPSSPSSTECKLSKPSAMPPPVVSISPQSQQVSARPTSDPPSTGQNGISESLLLPVSAVTLLPRVSVFSLPVTVLSTLPRPILPRIAIERPVSSMNLIPVPVPQTTMISTNTTAIISTTTITTTAASSVPTPTPVANVKLDDSKIPLSAVDNNFNRRYGKSFVCNQCRKEFTSLSLLCTHTFSVHRGFRCTICRAQFTQRSNLQRHSLRHVGFKPFVCKVCDKAYYRKDHLVRHIELTHPGCDPRTSLTVKLSSADCLDYLEKMQKDTTGLEQVQLLCQTGTKVEYRVPPPPPSLNTADTAETPAKPEGEKEVITTSAPSSVTNCISES